MGSSTKEARCLARIPVEIKAGDKQIRRSSAMRTSLTIG
jgi:hypothetical protein